MKIIKLGKSGKGKSYGKKDFHLFNKTNKKQKEFDNLSEQLSENHDKLKIMKNKKKKDILFTSKHNDKKRVLDVEIDDENKEIPVLDIDDVKIEKGNDIISKDNPFNN